MKLRLKGGVALLFLLMSIVFYYFIMQYNSWGMGPQENVFQHLAFGVIALGGVIIFLVGLNYVERKIEANNFSYGKLSLFNFIFYIVLTIIVEIFGLIILPLILMGLGFPDGEGMGFLFFFWLIYSPLVVLGLIMFFSLIPSIIFFKIYENPSAQKKFFYVAIILAILIFIFSFVMLFTCGLGGSGKCLQGKALAQQNIDVCDKGYIQAKRNNCYSAYFKEYPEQRDCSKIINDPSHKDSCFLSQARETKDISLCQIIINERYKEACLSELGGN